MLVAAAVCPQTPLLVPQIAGNAAGELADVRSAALDAVARLCGERTDLLIVLAPTEGSGARRTGLTGSLRRFGVDYSVGGHDGATEPCCGLLIGRWMLERTFPAAVPAHEGWEVGEQTEPGECARLGRMLGERAARVALLIMGDGSARRTPKAPGYFDERAEPFDDAVARALADADAAALAAVDPTAARTLMVAGRAPWQALAGAAMAASSRAWHGELLSYRAPYGVGYFTALWTGAEPDATARDAAR
ncbi:hypothetical protein KGA66_13295 [Actinocrinis puniceicyclus]|uniref:Extradiol ring-cleavage dioxygenase class III enzyme subunit B domain-containing protein n=1 Tax=Actinocrinis puniceicyclus TaxID=977794 RepID=A0A8J8BDD7_9ACTN|nr:hypothetical protein [Actinocrinis puniceicyclus]MBS2964026.1 hypothetical protein [Actinocrinis puniceicyclus]